MQLVLDAYQNVTRINQVKYQALRPTSSIKLHGRIALDWLPCTGVEPLVHRTVLDAPAMHLKFASCTPDKSASPLRMEHEH